MKFSVLMSVYKNDNPAHFEKALKSIENNTVPPDEVVLVVDGPIPDALIAIINNNKQFLPMIVIPLAKNVGLGNALAIGLPKCTHEWVARCDSDDICRGDRFEKQIEFIKKYPAVSLLSCWVAEFAEDINTVDSIRAVPETHDAIISRLKSRNAFNHMGVMFEKSKVIMAGSYQNDYLYEDYALWVRMAVNGCFFANIPDCLVYARTGNGMLARRGGIKYAVSEFKAQVNFRKLGFISTLQLMVNLFGRLPVRLAPIRVRQYVYKKFLRKRF